MIYCGFQVFLLTCCNIQNNYFNNLMLMFKLYTLKDTELEFKITKIDSEMR